MNTENLLFVIFQVSELNLINFSEVREDSIETVRISIDGTKTFVNWEGPNIPPSVQLLTTSEDFYTYNQMLTILSTPEWDQPLN